MKYSPLGAKGTRWGDNRIVECDVIGDIAKARGKTTAQVLFPTNCLSANFLSDQLNIVPT